MTRKALLKCVCLFLPVLFTAAAAWAQSGPIIESFTVDQSTLSYPEVEGGTAAANFSWRAVGLRESDQMQMHAWVGGHWILIGEGFEPEKTDQLVISHPLDFVPPKYRLSVVDATGTIVTEQILELSYAPPAELPSISMFYAFPPRDVIPMSAFDEPFRIQWEVRNRWFNSNIVFEQILSDGTVVNAEYPAAWQYAHATGYVQLVYPGDYQDVVLQLRVVNRDDGSTLAQQQLILHVANSQLPQPELVSFTATPELVDLNGTVTLNWEVANTDAVFIEYEDGNPNGSCAGNLEEVYELPPSGTLDVTAPDWAISPLRFRLFADYHTSGDRHHCGSNQTPLAELPVELTDYVHQGVEYFHIEPYRIDPYHFVPGDTFTVSWSVTEGQSVTITYPNLDAAQDQSDPNSIPVFATYADLPLTGSIEVTIPDNPGIRAYTYGYGYLWLYVIEAGEMPPVPDDSLTVFYDRDGNLECDPSLSVGDSDGAGPDDAVAGTDVSVTWDSCGLETTLLRLALVTDGSYSSDNPDREEFLPVNSSGTTTIRLPDEAGTFYIQLYYEHEGWRYMLRSSPLILSQDQG